MARTGSNQEMNQNKKPVNPPANTKLSTNNTICSNMSHHIDVDVDVRMMKRTDCRGLAPKGVTIFSDCYRILGLGFSFAKEVIYS